MFKCVVIKPSHIESTFLGDFKPYDNVSRVLIIEFFIKVLCHMFTIITKLLYTNIKFEDLTLTSLVNGVIVHILLDDFRKGNANECPCDIL